MLLGAQWYILFNVIAGASAIPANLKEAGTIYQHEPVANAGLSFICPAYFRIW